MNLSHGVEHRDGFQEQTCCSQTAPDQLLDVFEEHIKDTLAHGERLQAIKRGDTLFATEVPHII